jgi:anti-sigma regulatory factor (Ser/Thr protein kinase)
MEMILTEYVPITDTSSIGEARRKGLHLAERLGLDEVRSGEFALLINEIARNVLTHAGGGQAIITGSRNGSGPMVRLLGLDKGPGISDVPRAMNDGYSTSGTMGAGLGAMKRIANRMDIFTSPNGTIVMVEIGPRESQQELQVAGVAIPYPGERFCGDAWSYDQSPERTMVLIVDGLGHGREAGVAAEEAVAVFQSSLDKGPGEILSYINDALKKTRGAVAGIARITNADNTLTYAAVGNTAASALSKDGSRSLVAHSGTLGVASPRIQEFQMDWPKEGVLIMHSDGLQSRWDLSSYSGLISRHPAVIGAALIRDFRRQHDDASVVVVKSAA